MLASAEESLASAEGYSQPSSPSGSAKEKRLAMLRTQETLVISAVSSHWFHVEVTRAMRLLVGVTNDMRLQPETLDDMRLVEVDVRRGDRVKLLVTPSLGYGP